MKNADFDLVVIGGGPAIFTTEHTRAAQALAPRGDHREI